MSDMNDLLGQQAQWRLEDNLSGLVTKGESLSAAALKAGFAPVLGVIDMVLKGENQKPADVLKSVVGMAHGAGESVLAYKSLSENDEKIKAAQAALRGPKPVAPI